MPPIRGPILSPIEEKRLAEARKKAREPQLRVRTKRENRVATKKAASGQAYAGLSGTGLAASEARGLSRARGRAEARVKKSGVLTDIGGALSDIGGTVRDLVLPGAPPAGIRSAAGTPGNELVDVTESALRSIPGTPYVPREATRGVRDPRVRTEAALNLATIVPGGLAVRGAETAVRGTRAASAETKLARLGELLRESRVGQQVTRVAESPIGRAAGTGAKVASAPARHPVRTAAGLTVAGTAAQTAGLNPPAPEGVKQSGAGDLLGALKSELSGQGFVATAASAAGDLAASAIPGEVADNVVRDLFDLPAYALPSLYLPASAAVQYVANGDDAAARALLEQYKQVGLLPHLLSGDVGGALEAIKAHPIFTGLEATGAGALVGRAGGAVARAAPSARLNRLAALERDPLQAYGGIEVQRQFSKNLITKSFQVLADRRRAVRNKKAGREPTQLSSAEIERVLVPDRGTLKFSLDDTPLGGERRVDRKVAQGEVQRRTNREVAVREVLNAAPRNEVQALPTKLYQMVHQGLREAAGLDAKAADAVSFAIQRIARSPDTFQRDLATYREQIVRYNAEQGLTRSERAAVGDTLDAIDQAAALRPEQVSEVFRSADSFIERANPLTEALVERGVLDSAQAARAPLFPYARVHMGATHGKPVGGGPRTLLKPDGSPLTTPEILAHMERNGVKPPGFISHNPTVRGAGSFYRAFYPERQAIPGRRRTGEAVASGRFDTSWEAVVEQAVRDQTVLDSVRNLHDTLLEFAVRPTDRFFKDYQEALRASVDPQDFGLDLRGVDFVPSRISGRQQAEAVGPLLDDVAEVGQLLDPRTPLEGNLTKALLNQLESREPGNYVLVPRVVHERLLDHTRGAHALVRATQAVNTQFKRTVLTTSTKWALGNVLDVNMRAMAYAIAPFGLDPINGFVGRRLLRELREIDPAQADAVMARILGGAQFAGQKANLVRRGAQDFPASKVAASMGAFLRAPGIRTARELWNRYTDAIFAWNTKFIEQAPQYAALGKIARRDVQAMNKKWHQTLRLGDEAISDLAQGLRNTDAQVRYARGVEEMFGRWHVNSPNARLFLSTLSPFWMWARAATRFVGITLPVKHPVKTGMLAAAANMTQDERRRLGLAYGEDDEVPSFLRGSLPVKGQLIPTEKFTSFGLWADYPQFAANLVLPQFSGISRTLLGLDWKGDKVRKANGEELSDVEKGLLAFALQAEAIIPILGVSRRVLERGQSPEPGSNIFNIQTKGEGDTGSIIDGFVRVFAPFPIRDGKIGYDPELVEYLRSRRQLQEITVPIKSESERNPFQSVFGSPTGGSISSSPFGSGGSGSDNPFSTVFGGG